MLSQFAGRKVRSSPIFQLKLEVHFFLSMSSKHNLQNLSSLPPFCKNCAEQRGTGMSLFHWLRKFHAAFNSGQSLHVLTQARYFVRLSWQRSKGWKRGKQTGVGFAIRFIVKFLSVWSLFQRAENMSEGAVPITEEIEELRKKLALLGERWSTTFWWRFKCPLWSGWLDDDLCWALFCTDDYKLNKFNCYDNLILFLIVSLRSCYTSF